jgi:hypothetical protein
VILFSHLKTNPKSTRTGKYALFFWCFCNKEEGPQQMDVWTAARFGDLDWLKRYDGDLDALDDNNVAPLMWALSGGHLQCVSYLIAAGADPNKSGSVFWSRKPLCMAVSKGNAEAARILLQHGARTEITDRGGDTPLHIACIIKRIDIIRMLLINGASARSATAWYSTFEIFGKRQRAHRAALIVLGIAQFRVREHRDILKKIASLIAINY